MWPDLAKLWQFGKKLKALGNFVRVSLVFGKILNPLWQFFIALGQIFIVENGQIMYWSGHTGHWSPESSLCKLTNGLSPLLLHSREPPCAPVHNCPSLTVTSHAVWPDWVIYWTLGNFLKPFATINLPKSPTFLNNFWKGVKIYHFCSQIIFGQLL